MIQNVLYRSDNMKRRLLRVVRFCDRTHSFPTFMWLKEMILENMKADENRGITLKHEYRLHKEVVSLDDYYHYWCDKAFEFKDRLNKREWFNG